MSRAAPVAVLAAALAASVSSGCSSSSNDPPATAAPPPQQAADAGAAVDGITEIGSYDPSSGRHLDDDVPRTPTKPRQARGAAKPINVLLKSTPSRATAAVDGEVIGETPTMWSGTSDGREHDFTFEKPNHALARYRFIPITDGVVHARLVPIADDRANDAGVPNSSSSTFTPDAAVAPAPDAAVRVERPPPPPPRPDAGEPSADPGSGSSPPPPTGGAGPPP